MAYGFEGNKRKHWQIHAGWKKYQNEHGNEIDKNGQYLHYFFVIHKWKEQKPSEEKMNNLIISIPTVRCPSKIKQNYDSVKRKQKK